MRIVFAFVVMGMAGCLGEAEPLAGTDDIPSDTGFVPDMILNSTGDVLDLGGSGLVEQVNLRVDYPFRFWNVGGSVGAAPGWVALLPAAPLAPCAGFPVLWSLGAAPAGSDGAQMPAGNYTLLYSSPGSIFVTFDGGGTRQDRVEPVTSRLTWTVNPHTLAWSKTGLGTYSATSSLDLEDGYLLAKVDVRHTASVGDAELLLDLAADEPCADARATSGMVPVSSAANSAVTRAQVTARVLPGTYDLRASYTATVAESEPTQVILHFAPPTS